MSKTKYNSNMFRRLHPGETHKCQGCFGARKATWQLCPAIKLTHVTLEHFCDECYKFEVQQQKIYHII